MFNSLLNFGFDFLKSSLLKWWWLALLIAFLFILWDLWKTYLYLKHKTSIKWVFLEVKAPPDIITSPKAMEQVFAGLWASIRWTITLYKRYIHGTYQEWINFEIVLRKGRVHFYIRTPQKFRHLVESHIYAQYPQVEITEAEDYMQYLPRDILNEKYDFYGTEFKFLKEPVYPILTYPYFTESGKMEERTDPLANIIETFSKFPDSALVALQYYVRPKKDSEWRPAGEALVDELMGKARPKSQSFVDKIVSFVGDLFASLTEVPQRPESSEDKEISTLAMSPGTLEIIKSVERKLSKYAFDVGIRIFYLDSKENFDDSLTKVLISIFNPVNTRNMNTLIPNVSADTGGVNKLKDFLLGPRLRLKKRRLYRRILWQSFPYDPPLLNTEELATICRIPGIKVKAPLVEKLQVKTAEPPLDLPH